MDISNEIEDEVNENLGYDGGNDSNDDDDEEESPYRDPPGKVNYGIIWICVTSIEHCC